MKTYKGMITNLNDKQVFVFGSNDKGFHGGGSAGFASFGVFGNRWRDFDYGSCPDGWKGKWNVKGVGKGFQMGNEGFSYAIPTVTEAGAIKSKTLSEIRSLVEEFFYFAKQYTGLEFLVAYTCDGKNLNGYSAQEMASVFVDFPDNVIFEEGFARLIENCISKRRG